MKGKDSDQGSGIGDQGSGSCHNPKSLYAHPPMDQAKDILAYIQAKHPDKGYDVDGVMNELIKYDRRPDDLTKEVVETFSTISEIAGKTMRTLYNGLSLLKNPPEIQAAIRAGTLPVSQGYLFAANLDCPDLMKAVNSEW